MSICDNKRPEILAPAGSPEHLTAAVRCGADAVYLGLRSFSARAGAVNFDPDELKDAVRYCRRSGVRVYVAVNTLVKDNELEPVADSLKAVCDAGADAVLVQDLAVMRLIRDCCPGLPMHASTQMTVHNAAGVNELERLGFTRAVLARELSLDEMRLIRQKTNIELEVFVHGALCVCTSGACYLSSFLGGRSGNRGRCAGPCRLDFNNGERSFALSLKDMSYADRISDLALAGVDSLKIEGRLKRPEYVAAAVTAVRRSRDGLDYDDRALRDVFSRSGFTSGYLDGAVGADMFGVRSDEDAAAAKKVFPSLHELYRNEFPRVRVDHKLYIGSDRVTLESSDGANVVSSDAKGGETPLKDATDASDAARALSKTGGTPFFTGNVSVKNPELLFVPASELNGLRRECLDRLLDLRERADPVAFDKKIPVPPSSETVREQMRCVFRSASQIPASYGDLIVLPLSELTADPSLIDRYRERLAARLPFFISVRDEDGTLERLERLRSLGLGNAYCENLGAVALARRAGLSVWGGFGLNIINRVSLDEYRSLYGADPCVSVEASLSGGAFGDAFALTYGFVPLMRLRACPMRGKKGCSGCDGARSLTDRLGKRFTVLCNPDRYPELLNSVPLWVGDKCAGRAKKELYFTVESPERCARMIDMTRAGAPFDGEYTRGLYFNVLI